MSVIIISRYNKATKMYHPEFVVDLLTQAQDYVENKDGNWASLVEYPNEKTYTIDVAGYQSSKP